MELYNDKDFKMFIPWCNFPIEILCKDFDKEILLIKNNYYQCPQRKNNVLKFLYFCKKNNLKVSIIRSPIFYNKRWYYLI